MDRTTLRIAYLNTEYPSLSHTFIEREIRSVRSSGINVQPFSIRRPTSSGTLSDDHKQAEADTVYILDRSGAVLITQLRSMVSHPVRYLRTLVRSQRLSPPGLGRRARHVAYALEGVRLAQEMAKRHLNHVHVHMANNGAAVALLACAFDPSLQYSLSIHGSAEFFNVDGERIAQKVQSASFVRCISNFCKAQVMAATDPGDWAKMHIVHCGVDTDRFAPTPQAAAPESRPLQLLTVGRFHPIKGYGLVLEAIKHLHDRGLRCHLDMVGDGPMHNELQALAATLGIADSITFSGAVGQDSIHEHYHRADVFVVSSFMEGVPVVLMEAMAMGKPVITTRVGGIAELVDDGRSGWLVDPGSAEALASALANASASRDRFAEMGRHGRSRVVNAFDMNAVGSEMSKLIKSEVFGDKPFPVPRTRHRPPDCEFVARDTPHPLKPSSTRT